MNKPVCTIIGAGPGNGAAFARRFDKAGYRVALLARNLQYLGSLAGEISDGHAFQCDATDTGRISAALSEVEQSLGAIDVLIYNAGSGVFGNIENVALADIENAWRINTLGLAAAAKQVMPTMLKRQLGNIVVIGATASLRGGANFAAFASAKAAQRNLTQSIARHLGPNGVHVSYVIIDGIIDSKHTRERIPDMSPSAMLTPDDIAESIYFLVRQPRSAWTFELDLRPCGEPW